MDRLFVSLMRQRAMFKNYVAIVFNFVQKQTVFLVGTLTHNSIVSVVAVKSLRPGGSLSSEDLLKEVHAMHKLRHDRLVKLIGFCINNENNQVQIVMEKMSKGSLKDLLKDQGKKIEFFNLMAMANQVWRNDF